MLDVFHTTNETKLVNVGIYRVEEKYASAIVHYKKNNFLGHPFHEFKLWLIPEVTLHSKVAFGKK